jgi:hypothetical protein
MSEKNATPSLDRGELLEYARHHLEQIGLDENFRPLKPNFVLESYPADDPTLLRAKPVANEVQTPCPPRRR